MMPLGFGAEASVSIEIGRCLMDWKSHNTGYPIRYLLYFKSVMLEVLYGILCQYITLRDATFHLFSFAYTLSSHQYIPSIAVHNGLSYCFCTFSHIIFQWCPC